MSSRNDDSAGTAAAFGIILAGLYFLAIAAAVFIALMAFVLTLFSIMAWNRPLRVHKIVITPEEARGFVWRGVIGLFAAPLILVLCQMFFHWPINWDFLLVFLIGGYCIGSIGIEMLLGKEKREGPLVEYLPSEKAETLAPVHAPAPPREPFRFASWDDEKDVS